MSHEVHDCPIPADTKVTLQKGNTLFEIAPDTIVSETSVRDAGIVHISVIGDTSSQCRTLGSTNYDNSPECKY